MLAFPSLSNIRYAILACSELPPKDEPKKRVTYPVGFKKPANTYLVVFGVPYPRSVIINFLSRVTPNHNIQYLENSTDSWLINQAELVLRYPLPGKGWSI
jgi:hypothetical protein